MTTVRNIQRAQFAAVLHDRHGKLPRELRASRETKLLEVTAANLPNTERNKGVKTVEQGTGRDKRTVCDQKTAFERENLQLPTVLKNVLDRVVVQLLVPIEHKNHLDIAGKGQEYQILAVKTDLTQNRVSKIITAR